MQTLWQRWFRRPTSLSPASLASHLAPFLGSRSMTLLDIGARWGLDPRWNALEPLAQWIGFEPDADECARLQTNAKVRYVPVALGRTTGPATLHVTADPACSSLLPPRADMCRRYPGLDVLEAVEERSVNVLALDDWTSKEACDVHFIKLDTQGSELAILQGGERTLQRCLGLEVEVVFTPMYENSPRFSDIELFLRSHGFHCWRIDNLAHYAERPARKRTHTLTTHFDTLTGRAAAGSGRLTWANALFFRDPRELPTTTSLHDLLRLAALFDAVRDDDAVCTCVERALGADIDANLLASLQQHLREAERRI